MSIKSILMPVNSAEDIGASLQSAAVLAGGFGAQIRACYVRKRPDLLVLYDAYPMSLTYSPETEETWIKAERDKAHHLRELFEKEWANLRSASSGSALDGVTAAWEDFEGDPSMGLVAAARVADLTIFALAPDKKPDPLLALLQPVLEASGHPVLYLPKNAMTSFPQKIIVGWNGSGEAAGAVTAVLPILKQASSVSILTIDQINRDYPSGEQAAAYLKLHGVKATAQSLVSGEGGVAGCLLKTAQDAGADLVVMGAYSHTRWRELVLGGVTRQVLHEADLPVLLVH